MDRLHSASARRVRGPGLSSGAYGRSMPLGPRRTVVAGRRPIAPRRRGSLVWATFDQTVSLAAAVTKSNVNLLANLQVAGASTLGCTIMRVRGAIAVSSTVAVGDRLRVGVLVDRLSEVGTAATSVDPSDLGLDWMLWRHEVAAPTFNWNANNNIMEYDIRSKRRCDELDQTLLLCLQNDVGAAKTVVVQIRTLVRLS